MRWIRDVPRAIDGAQSEFWACSCFRAHVVMIKAVPGRIGGLQGQSQHPLDCEKQILSFTPDKSMGHEEWIGAMCVQIDPLCDFSEFAQVAVSFKQSQTFQTPTKDTIMTSIRHSAHQQDRNVMRILLTPYTRFCCKLTRKCTALHRHFPVLGCPQYALVCSIQYHPESLHCTLE